MKVTVTVSLKVRRVQLEAAFGYIEPGWYDRYESADGDFVIFSPSFPEGTADEIEMTLETK